MQGVSIVILLLLPIFYDTFFMNSLLVVMLCFCNKLLLNDFSTQCCNFLFFIVKHNQYIIYDFIDIHTVNLQVNWLVVHRLKHPPLWVKFPHSFRKSINMKPQRLLMLLFLFLQEIQTAQNMVIIYFFSIRNFIQSDNQISMYLSDFRYSFFG